MLKKTMEELDRLSPEQVTDAEKHPIIVILDEVRSMHNVGSVFRTCDALAVERLLLCGYTPLPPHRDIHKTALGATETVSWAHFPTTVAAIESCKQNGYKVIAVEQVHGSISLEKAAFAPGEKIALIFGNEVTGVSDQALALADQCLEIPQWGSKHSLNIAVSVGIVLWEMVRG